MTAAIVLFNIMNDDDSGSREPPGARAQDDYVYSVFGNSDKRRIAVIIFDLTITFTEPCLGAAPMSHELYTDFIATKRGVQADGEARRGSPAGDGEQLAEELETLPDGDKGKTGFHRLPDGAPMLYDYVLKGFFKDACGMLRYDADSLSKKRKAYKRLIDGVVFVTPRRIPLAMAGPMEVLERPLRAQTMQGERVALAYSEMVPVGTLFRCEIRTLGDAIDEAQLREWLDYGALRGIGQWRNGSWGRFEYTLVRR